MSAEKAKKLRGKKNTGGGAKRPSMREIETKRAVSDARRRAEL